MRTIFAVEYLLPGPNNQTLYRFTSESAANDYMNLMSQDPMYRSHFQVVKVPAFDSLFEALDSNPPVCGKCKLYGHVVETVTDMLVWHHENPAIEDEHDFEPADGRSQIIRPFIDG